MDSGRLKELPLLMLECWLVMEAELPDTEQSNKESGGYVPSSEALSYSELRLSARLYLLGGSGGASELLGRGKNKAKVHTLH